MEQMTLGKAVVDEIARRISIIEKASKDYPCYAFLKRRRANQSLANYRRLQATAVIDDTIMMLPPTNFDPTNPEDIALRDLLASPDTFDS